MPVDAVIFDWGGTLTPWRTIDPRDEWRSVAAIVGPEQVEELTDALVAAATDVWARSRDQHRSSTLEEICALAGVAYDDDRWHDSYRSFWQPATLTDPDVVPLFERLRADGIRVGILSNTVWPGDWHDEIFVRDGLTHLIDGAVYTSDIAWTKPAPQAFFAAMESVGVSDPAGCVFVGDRLFDDIYGAHNAGMRAIHLPHSAIPSAQLGHTEGEPDAVIDRLADIPDVIAPWR